MKRTIPEKMKQALRIDETISISLGLADMELCGKAG